MSGEFILAQLSDMHVTAEPRADGFDPQASLERALEDLRAYRPHAILATGDLVNDARAEEYESLAKILRRVSLPLFVVPGNHDDRRLLREAFSDRLSGAEETHLSYAVDDFPVRLVCFDQTTPGAVHGEVTPELAEWLDRTLAQVADKPTIVAMHHPPFLTHDLLFDKIGLRAADRFAAIIAKHPQVIRILCGHHHRTVIGQVAHAPVICAPSTAWGFSLALNEDQHIARKQPEPGWALHHWRAGAGLASHVMPLSP